MKENCLPVSNYEPNGRGYYYDYWINFCDGHPTMFTTGHYQRLIRDYGATYHAVIGRDEVPYIRFKDPKTMTLFLLRWS